VTSDNSVNETYKSGNHCFWFSIMFHALKISDSLHFMDSKEHYICLKSSFPAVFSALASSLNLEATKQTVYS